MWQKRSRRYAKMPFYIQKSESLCRDLPTSKYCDTLYTQQNLSPCFRFNDQEPKPYAPPQLYATKLAMG